MYAADDQNAAQVDCSRLWDHRRSRIKALDDKFRWKLNELGVRTVHWVCHGSSPSGLYPSIRVRTAPPASVRVRVGVSVSFSFSVTLLRILFCMCPKDT